jgi:hypothetical protein
LGHKEITVTHTLSLDLQGDEENEAEEQSIIASKSGFDLGYSEHTSSCKFVLQMNLVEI